MQECVMGLYGFGHDLQRQRMWLPSRGRCGHGTSPIAVAVDPSSRFAYVVNRIDNTVSMFTIDTLTGNLTPHGVIETGTQPFRIAFDRSGKFLYVVNEQGLNSVYTINSNGTLKSAGMTVTKPANSLSAAQDENQKHLSR
jgi:DNA-binding beta-propeller fold protein YncE